MDERTPELLELERQLSRPSGEKGLEVAEMMHATNIGMTTATLDRLSLDDGKSVLELGHGNCAHLPLILARAAKLRYTGLEISETMHEEALGRHEETVRAGQAQFRLYDGVSVPFDDESFDRVFSVNCLYFWQQPRLLLEQIARVLKPGGIAAITFAHKDFMQRLPFIGDRFRLYDPEDFTALVRETPFTLVAVDSQRETVRSKTGEELERGFSVGILKKTTP